MSQKLNPKYVSTTYSFRATTKNVFLNMFLCFVLFGVARERGKEAALIFIDHGVAGLNVQKIKFANYYFCLRGPARWDKL